ncbi:MAG TPA: hypothetical protein VMU66_01560 [Gaiellales bacterium]|nr:hypothetical protein [Gaiellales bacterium]
MRVRQPGAAGERWLFLTPEPEAELPAVAAAMAAAMGEPGDPERERSRMDALVRDGGYQEWLAHLSAQRRLVDRYAARFGDDALVRRALEVLENHHLLALTVPDPDGRAAAERGAVEAIAARAGGGRW